MQYIFKTTKLHYIQYANVYFTVALFVILSKVLNNFSQLLSEVRPGLLLKLVMIKRLI